MISIGHLDLNVVTHCNKRCVACSHASPFTKAWSMSLDSIERDLKILKPILKPHSINVVGGEPLLHPKIDEILMLLELLRLDTSTTVITNGLLLPKMTETFWRTLEYLSISQYPTLPKECLDLAKAKSSQYGFGLGIRVFDSFYLQFEENDGSNFKQCPWKSDCFTVHDGYFYLCPQSVFFPHLFMGLKKAVDGLPLEGITEDTLRAFMQRQEPFNACRICGAYKRQVPWSEASTLEEWQEKSKL